MTGGTPERPAAVGVVENGNEAVLVTVGAGGVLLDRRTVALTEGLPTHPYHHEGAWALGRYLQSPWARPIALPDALALIERVHTAAEQGARAALEALACGVEAPVVSIAIRRCAALPPTYLERITDNRAQTMADSIMYRQALAAAGAARGWAVAWYDREHVAKQAAAALSTGDLDALLRAMGRAAGPPWRATHKLAAAAALAALAPGR